MNIMLKAEAEELYQLIKAGKIKYKEEIHCAMILLIMAHPEKGTVASFCKEVKICDKTFYNWLNQNDLFLQCYSLGKVLARAAWEEEGRELRNEICMPGAISFKFEHWRMMGWANYGIGKTMRIRLKLDADATPDKHYSQLIRQASDGDFTSGEIKQLMEAINVGLNTHQVFTLQKEIDQLKSDLATMVENSNGNNPVAT